MYRDIRVLLVEDDHSLRRLWDQSLSAKHFRTQATSCMAEAMDAMQNGTFDILVLDLKLPNGDGRHILERWHKNPASGPVVVVSGYLNECEANEMLSSAWNVLQKPIDPDILVDICERYALVVRGARAVARIKTIEKRMIAQWIVIAALAGTEILKVLFPAVLEWIGALL